MFEFYLDNTRVEEPESFNNISFEKKRDEKLFGFLLRNKGLVKVEGAGQIKFSEPKAVQILKAAKKANGFGAIVTFTVKSQGLNVYEGTVNFWNTEAYSESVVVTFTDGSNVLKFIANRGNRYQIATNKSIILSSDGVIGKTTHSISNVLYTFRQKSASPLNYSHAIPLVQSSGSSNATISETVDFNNILPIYTNDSEKKTVSIKGQIYFSVKTDNGGSFQIKVNDIIVQQFSSGSTQTEKFVVIDEELIIDPYQTISLSVSSLADSSDTIFIYDSEKSQLSIYEIKDNVRPTNVSCISSYDILSKIIDEATEGTMTLESSFLKSINHNWTNGKNLRGVEDVINASFEDIYLDHDKQYCLYTTIKDNKVVIERRVDIKKKATRSFLDRDRIASEFSAPNRDFLFSTIKAGYKTWQGDSTLSNQETNSYLELQTNIFGRQNPLDLVCESISSGILIEEIRQTQFGKVSNDQQKKYDDVLINLIENDGYDYYKSSSLNSDAKNLSIRPYQMALNWAAVLGGYSKWRFISGTGNYDAIINGESQKKDITSFGGILSSDIWNIEYKCELWEYREIGEVIQWTDTNGKPREGILNSAQWSQSNKAMLLEVFEYE